MNKKKTGLINLSGKPMTAESNKGKCNAYICGNLHVLLTKDVDAGLTPFLIVCPEPECKMQARSMMYQINQNFINQANMEWYRADETEMLKLSEKVDKATYNRSLEFWSKGGLFSRPCKTEEDAKKPA